MYAMYAAIAAKDYSAVMPSLLRAVKETGTVERWNVGMTELFVVKEWSSGV